MSATGAGGRTVGQRIAAAAADGLKRVHPLGLIDDMLNQFDLAWRLTAEASGTQEAKKARVDLTMICAAVAHTSNPAGIGCAHSTVIAFIHCCRVWRDFTGTPPEERKANGEAAQILAAAIRKARLRIWGNQ